MKVAKRETAVLIRLSEREKRTLKRKAANYGMTVSDYARTLLINSDDATIKVIDTEPLKKAAHGLAKQGTNLNQFMKFLMIQRIIFGQDAVAYDVALVRDAAGI